jgi:uncharacterized ferredoxin-like protein
MKHDGKSLEAEGLLDTARAVGSAVSMAVDRRIDNRVFFSAGRAAVNLKVRIAYGIPLSVGPKSPFFDRK